jgi:hypothetical protein
MHPDPSLRKGMNEIAQAYIAALGARPLSGFIPNLTTRVQAFAWEGRVLPLTINDGEKTGTYVCSPLTAYTRYTREELRNLPMRVFDTPLKTAIMLLDWLLRLAAIDRIVHVNNWMLSTNLNGGLVIKDAAAFTQALITAHGDHIIAVRSLNRWSDARLMQSLAGSGWLLVPSRQVYVIDNIRESWLCRRDARRDVQLAADTQLRFTAIEQMSVEDAAMIAELYAKL